MDENIKLILAIESFLRSSCDYDVPFMLKGSIITRQFFPDPAMRLVQDLDWVYMKKLNDPASAKSIFSSWVIDVTENTDGLNVPFRSFKENNFWRSIDYAMNEDFPTVNTDLLCYVNGEEFDYLGLDISFNLDLDFRPEKLNYIPLEGEPFLLQKVCPFALQVSWKLHQLIVRPRLKDVFDLIFLLQHERFNETELDKILFALKKECEKDNLAIMDLSKYLDADIEHEKTPWDKVKEYVFNPYNSTKKIVDFEDEISANEINLFTKQECFPYKKHSEIKSELKRIMNAKGFTKERLSKC